MLLAILVLSGVLGNPLAEPMKYSPTTVFGMLGAIALAVANVPGLAPWALTACHVVSVACVAGIGYHAQDRSAKPPSAPGASAAILLAASLVALTGCKVGGLGIEVKSPTFGSVGISLDGGIIGHGKVPTNAPTPLPSLP
jgi:energy-converting hydrogenase Eha subunit B